MSNNVQEILKEIASTQKEALDFIVYVNTAAKMKWTRQKLAIVLGIQPASLRRRTLNVKKQLGLPMAPLDITEVDTLEIKDEDIVKFFETAKKVKAAVTMPSSYISSVVEDKASRKVGKYVITSAQNATPLNMGFLNSIHQYCAHNDAKLIVIPYRYKNPTSIFSVVEKEADWWAPAIKPYLIEENIRLCKELLLIGAVKIQPTAVQPLSGFESYTGESSAIFGHPKIQQKTVPTPSQELPKILMTTGAVTVPNYTESKAGFKGEFHHSYGAIVLEINETEFHVRHIHGKGDDGSFYDLDKHYSPNTVTSGHRAAALITGDTHALFLDETVEGATYSAEDSICNTLKPEMKVYHDLTDFYSRNHHHRGNDLVNIAKYYFGRDSVESELQLSADLIDKYNSNDCLNVIAKSNHDEAFDRWLREADPKTDPVNARFYYYMKYNQVCNITKTDTGFNTIDPFEFWCKNPDLQKGLINVENTLFLKRDQSLKVAGIELSFHGDRGPNGAKGSINGFSKIGPKVVIGHSHSPGIYEGVYQVGTSSRLDLEYQSGPSSWMHTHCLIYQDGSRTLINIINGKWRA